MNSTSARAVAPVVLRDSGRDHHPVGREHAGGTAGTGRRSTAATRPGASGSSRRSGAGTPRPGRAGRPARRRGPGSSIQAAGAGAVRAKATAPASAIPSTRSNARRSGPWNRTSSYTSSGEYGRRAGLRQVGRRTGRPAAGRPARSRPASASLRVPFRVPRISTGTTNRPSRRAAFPDRTRTVGRRRLLERGRPGKSAGRRTRGTSGPGCRAWPRGPSIPGAGRTGRPPCRR